MKALIYFPLFIAFQLTGDFLKEELALAIPGPTIGMLMLLIFLFIIPPNKNMTESAQKLIFHLPLLFIPAGVGVMVYVDVLKQDSLALFVSVFGSTLVCLILAAFLTQFLLKYRNDKSDEPREKAS